MGAGTVVDGLDHLEVEVGRLERELGALGADQHVGENRNGVAPLDHAMHVGQRSQELGALDRDLHAEPRWMEVKAPASGCDWLHAGGAGGGKPAPDGKIGPAAPIIQGRDGRAKAYSVLIL